MSPGRASAATNSVRGRRRRRSRLRQPAGAVRLRAFVERWTVRRRGSTVRPRAHRSPGTSPCSPDAPSRSPGRRRIPRSPDRASRRHTRDFHPVPYRRRNRSRPRNRLAHRRLLPRGDWGPGPRYDRTNAHHRSRWPSRRWRLRPRCPHRWNTHLRRSRRLRRAAAPRRRRRCTRQRPTPSQDRPLALGPWWKAHESPRACRDPWFGARIPSSDNTFPVRARGRHRGEPRTLACFCLPVGRR